MKNLCASFLAISASLIPSAAYSGAWLQEEGKGQIITSLRYYTTDKTFDNNGSKKPSSDFSKTDFAPYFEYGLKDYVTIGGEFDFARVDNDSPAYTDMTGFKFSYANIFARTYLNKGSNYVISVEPGITFPRSLGNDLVSDGEKPIPELKLALGYSFEHMGRHHFVDASMKYRLRTDNDLDDMIKAEINFGYRFADDFMALTQLTHEEALGDIDGTLGNYVLTRPQVSVVYDQNEKLAHQVGAFSNLYGENTGAGYGFGYSLWYKF